MTIFIYLPQLSLEQNSQLTDIHLVLAKYSFDGLVEWQRLLDYTAGYSFGAFFFGSEVGGSNLAVKQDYVAVGLGFGSEEIFEGPGSINAAVAQIPASGNVFTVGNWDFKAASFSGTVNSTASDITVVNAGKTDYDNIAGIDTATVTLEEDSSDFLIGTLFTAPGGDNSLVNGAYSVTLENTGTVTLPAGGTITEGYVTSNPTIQLTPASPDVASQKLVIKGGGAYTYTDNGISINYNNNTAIVGNTLTFYINSNTYADQTLYWWIYPEGAGIGDTEYGTVVLSGSGGSFSILIDSDDYEFTVRVSPEEDNYGPGFIGVETGLINADEPTFDVDYHLHLTTGNLSETSIFLGTDDHNVRTTVNGGIEITTPNETNNVWQFETDGSLTLPGDIRSEGNINIDINLSDSTLRRWQFGEDGGLTLPSVGKISNGAYDWTFGTDGGLTFPDGTVQTTAAEAFSFSVAADDSTQRAISNNELIKFIGAGGITTSSDAEGYITITGSGGSVSSLVNSTKTLSLGSDGSLTSNGALTIKTPNGIPNSVSNWVGGGGWNSPPYSNLATTGGTGTGLTVNVSAADGGYININYITIATAGTGYTAGDVITITNENNIPGTFTIGVTGTRDWQFGIDGSLTLPSNGIIQSVQSGNYQSKVTVSPLQILSQARTSQAQSYTVAGEAFTSASGDGAGLITFVNPSGSMTEFLIDTMEYGGVYERTVRINGAGPEYQYNYFGGGDSIVLSTYPAAGAVTDIRFSYTRISKIDIAPDAEQPVFKIESESGLDIDIQSGRDLDIVATDHAWMTSGTEVRLQSGTGVVNITTNYAVPNTTQRDWQFDNNGQLTLPNGAVLRNTANGAIAFGSGAGGNSQGATAIAIGNDAGYYPQGADAVAIGRSAGEDSQGANAIAIGLFAGRTNQAANSIIINATGANLDQTTANTFTVAPIRNISATSGVLQYNASTKEVSYSLNVTAETFNTDQITLVGNRITTTVTNANLELECNGTGGVVINTVAEATTASTARSVGYLGIPASAVTTTATLTIADAGEHIYLTSTGQTITIPANASVAYPIGTTLTFIAGPSATTTTIAITTDTMYLAGTGTTGSRTLAAHGMATAVKVAATTWYINGTGLT
jgi:hypothetical protein